jgi:para-nitrobenzyl esterase
MWATACLLGLASTAAQAATPVMSAVVATDAGKVRGSIDNGAVAFRGIAFAAPPVGVLRWRAPQPVRPWAGIRDAAAFGPSCMQVDDVAKSEDCLTLNVWRPAAMTAKRLPVMVWIHGGSLMHGGTALYPGHALARQGVIVVSMNYRMGRLGFFAHPAAAAEAPGEPTGNFGYLDQLAALKWVQANIHNFGGDPENVTIFGESAGGGSVLVHLTSPLSRGLFRRAILQSPAIPTARADTTPLTGLAAAQGIAVDYARTLGILDTGATGLAALRKLPAAVLTEGASSPLELAAVAAGTHVPGASGAIVDGRMVFEAPEQAFARGRQARVPVMVGANDRDLGLGVAATKEALFARFGSLADAARQTYDPDGSASFAELKQQVLADETMVEPVRHLADMASASVPVWHYRFAYVPQARRTEMKGTPHGLEIPYVIDLPASVIGEANVTQADRDLASLTSAFWVSFARTGDPNGAGRPHWARHTPGSEAVFQFTNTGAAMAPDPLWERLDLWEQVHAMQGDLVAR